ncbi:MAG: helix-turn-helix domain-containing protein [Anaerolineales bacterium]|nr:helix-turn-helix domain-containing protein [Anaerolineales bacterium]
MKTFGEWLREQRTARRLTREEFSSRVGCSTAMLRKIEDDERRPSAQIAELIANCLEIDDRETFVKVARGEWTTDRLSPVSQRVQPPNFPPTQTSSSNLPILPTPLIGRQQEVDELCKLLTDPHCRMLTIAGPGGMGKTRLALETASRSQTDYEDGVYFVPLAPIHSSRFLIPVIADSMGFTLQGEHQPKEQLFNYLKDKHTLLLIDNLEHLLGDATVPEFFAELLEKTSKLKLLVTSRESIGLQGEWMYEIHGLPIPEGTDIDGTSVELFLQRARRAHVSFDATMEDYPAIVRICNLVNGMPLGIELAAAWVRTLSCREIASEIEHGLDFLSISAKDVPTRHRSIRAVFDHSWKLLTEEEQKILLHLAIFQGGFSREAAQEIANAALPALSALVSKSLIRRNGMGRYDLHEIIRQYAAERLADQPEVKEEAQALHGRYFINFLGQEDLPLRSSTQRESLAKLVADIDNIRSALEWALARQEFVLIETGLRAYSTLYDMLGWYQEGLDYLKCVQDVLSNRSLSDEEKKSLAHVLTARSLFALRTSQHEETQLMLEESLELLKSVHDPNTLEEALTFLGIINIIMGNLARAANLFEEGLKTARSINDKWYEALCLTELVGVDMLLGKTETMHEQFQAAVEAWRKTGDLRFTAFGLTSLSLSAKDAQEYDEAQAALEESIEINAMIGDRMGLGNAYRSLGLLAQAQEKHVEAYEAFQKSLHYFNELGARWDIARLLSEMGRSALALGNDLEAEALWHESLKLSLDTQGPLTALDVLVDIADLQARRGNYSYALQLSHYCLINSFALLKTRARAERLAEELKDKVSPREMDAASRFKTDDQFEDVARKILLNA